MGDSLSAAYGIAESTGWVSLLQDRLHEKGYAAKVINASISGETTRGALTRLGGDINQHNPAIVILQLGGNDGLRGIAMDEMRANLTQMIEKIHYSNAEVLLVGIELPPNYGPVFTQQFRKVYHDLAKDYALSFVPFLLAGVAEDWDLMQTDGIHPTAAAQPQLLDNVWPTLKGLLEDLNLADNETPRH